MPSDDRMVAALLRERVGYVRAGQQHRVDQVDEQIRFYGGKPPAEKAEENPDENAGKDAQKQPPQGRSAQPRQTTK